MKTLDILYNVMNVKNLNCPVFLIVDRKQHNMYSIIGDFIV